MRYDTLLDRVATDTSDQNGALVAGLRTVADLVGDRSTPLLQLRVFSRMRPFLRHIVCNVLMKEYPNPPRLPLRPAHHPDIYREFMRLAHDLGVVTPRGDRYEASSRYARNGDWRPPSEDKQAYDEALEWVANLDSHHSVFSRGDTKYLVTMFPYLQELERIDFTQKIRGTLDPSFYSDLGRIAYELYTAQNFKEVVSAIHVTRFADIGCGDGLQLLDVREVHPASTAVGYEVNPSVAHSLAKRTERMPDVEIRAQNALEGTEVEEYDMVLAIYMLFYLPAEQRIRLLRRIWKMLKPGGKLVVGQYFPDIPDIQRASMSGLARVDPLRPYQTAVSQSILAAEIVLNRALDDFASVLYWDDFTDELETAGFEIERISPADNMYYSFFIVCGRVEAPGSAP